MVDLPKVSPGVDVPEKGGHRLVKHGHAPPVLGVAGVLLQRHIPEPAPDLVAALPDLQSNQLTRHTGLTERLLAQSSNGAN